jgi:hypothetical protein
VHGFRGTSKDVVHRSCGINRGSRKLAQTRKKKSLKRVNLLKRVNFTNLKTLSDYIIK